MAEHWPLESGLRAEAIQNSEGVITGVKVIGNTGFSCRFLSRLASLADNGKAIFSCGPGSLIMIGGRQRAKIPIPPIEGHLATDIAIALFEGGRARGLTYDFDGHTVATIILG